jgi:Zn-dependent M28 family amino/carboxypeptidase
MRKLIPCLFASATLMAAPANLTEQYNETAKKLITAAMDDKEGLDRFEFLCDRIGNRLSGSKSLEKAITWAAAEMKKAGLENVQTPPVKVPHWVRGAESAMMLTPLERPIIMLGLGGSIATPPGGITAEVVVVANFSELTALGKDKVAGKIVLFDAPYEGYGQTVIYRSGGASAAAKLGAVASLTRSVTGLNMRVPHTGAMIYEDGVPKIPAAAVSVEDSMSIARLTKTGQKVTVKLQMEAKTMPEADAANVMGEIRGSEKPDEYVVLGGHIDSWDVGQGAQDDGSGMMAALEAVSLIKKLGLKPKRSIRVVFWVNEENGGAGGVAYRTMLGDGIKNTVAAIEMDGGAEKPVGFGLSAGGVRRRRGAPAAEPPARAADALSEAAYVKAGEIGMLLESIGAARVMRGGGGSDIGPLMADGVPGLGMQTVGTHYFDWHHTNADTFDKINPVDFKQCAAAMAVMSFVLADMPERLTEIK